MLRNSIRVLGQGKSFPVRGMASLTIEAFGSPSKNIKYGRQNVVAKSLF
jgi:hypothetical protein